MVKRVIFTIASIIISGLIATGAMAQTTTGSVYSEPGSKITPLPSLGLNSLEKMKPNGELIIYISKGKTWQQIGSLGFDKYLRERKINLDKFIPGAKPAKLLIKQKGGGNANLDSVLLEAKSPLQVNGGKGLPLKKLSKQDNDLINIEKQGVVLNFPGGRKNSSLTLAARIESTKIGQIPFQFPLENTNRNLNVNSAFYSYRLNSSQGTLKIGSMQKAFSAEKPLFKEYVTPGSGHPAGFTYGWVRNDAQNLYVGMDFTPDNTMDGAKDYAKVYVKTDKGLRMFKVSVPETKWGKASFVYTDKVAYQHKFYEFVIPLKELDIKPGSEAKDLEMAFAAYGTASWGELDPAMAYDPEYERYLVVYNFYGESVFNGVYGQFIDKNGTPGEPFQIASCSDYGLAPAIAYDSNNYSFLVVWSEDRNHNNKNEIYGRIVTDENAFLGNDFLISDAYFNSDTAINMEKPTVAFDTKNYRYLVTWVGSDYDSFTDIFGQFVDTEGMLIGNNIMISDTGRTQMDSAIAFDDINKRFLVAWGDNQADYYTVGKHVYAQLIDESMNLYGGRINIAETDSYMVQPAIAFDSTNQRFLLAWNDNYVTANVYGRLLNADGTMPGARFVISDSASYVRRPVLSLDNVTGKYFAMWIAGSYTPYEIKARLVSADGVPEGYELAVNNVGLVYDIRKATVAFNPDGPNFFVGYEGNGDTYGNYISDIGFNILTTLDFSFKDTYLLKAVRDAVYKPGRIITASDLVDLTSLEATGIYDLSGLELATNLRELRLSDNEISDLKPLAGLTKLERLYLSHNDIMNVEPLSQLTNLKALYLGENHIEDISPLANLTGLRELWLNHNSTEGYYLGDLKPLGNLTNLQVLGLQRDNIEDISHLAKFTKLRILYLEDNDIRNLSPLTNLKNLQGVYLRNNNIYDITPLVANSKIGGLGQGNYLDLQLNPLDLATNSVTSSNLKSLEQSGVICIYTSNPG